MKREKGPSGTLFDTQPTTRNLMATAPTVAAAPAAPAASVATAPVPKKRAYGDRMLVTASTHSQVNDLTGQRIPHGGEVKVAFDRWIEIQLAAGVISEVSL